MFGTLTDRIKDLLEEGQHYDRWSMAPSTRDLYRRMWFRFERWCREHQVLACPAEPEIVAVYITDLARHLRASSIGVHLAAIRHHHLEAGRPSPTDAGVVKRRMSGIRRAKGMTPCRKKPLLLDDLDKVLPRLGAKKKALRDRAMFMLAFAAGLRRSELVGLDLEGSEPPDRENGGTGYVRFTAQGLDVVITRSKTDQDGEGHVIAVPLRRNPERCPVRLLQAWLQAAEIDEGPIFRSVTLGEVIGKTRLRSSAVAVAVKRAVSRLGYQVKEFAGHSLRAGFVTTCALAGAPVSAMQATTRHRQVQTLFGYVRQVRRYDESALRFIPSW